MSQSSYSFPPGVAFQQLGDDQDGVMMSLASGYLYRCNRTATVVLAAISAGKPIEDAVTELSQRFGIHTERVRTDVETLVEGLRKRKLLCEAA
jgi:hypothetical protein